MTKSRWPLVCMLLAHLGQAHADPFAHQINASSIGNGARAIDWTAADQQTPVWCGTACTYLQISAAKIAPESAITYLPSAWPNVFTTNFPAPAAIVRQTYTPTNTYDSDGRLIVYDSANYEHGAVDLARTGQASVSARVFQSGGQTGRMSGMAAAVSAYHVQVQNQSSGARDFFIRFTAPQSLQGAQPAYSMGGPSGNQAMYIAPEYGKGRSSVDVLVNGLPVWSTASNYVFPTDYTGAPNAGFATDWGYASAYDRYTVFIGRFASAASFNIDFIVQADSTARASQCGTEAEPLTYPSPRLFVHCYLLSEGRNLQPASAAMELFDIYSLDVSTSTLRSVGGFLP